VEEGSILLGDFCLVVWVFSNIKIKYKPGYIHALENLPLMETVPDPTHKPQNKILFRFILHTKLGYEFRHPGSRG